MEAYHKAVMKKEVRSGLKINPDGVYVDLTFGGGSHAKAILECLQNGRLIAFDQDEDARANIPDDDRFLFVQQNFKYFINFLKYLNFPKVDGILADLGVSSHHFDTPERGFSFRFEGPLDMRMNKAYSLTAADILNTYSEHDLAQIFRSYGELRNAKKLAAAVVEFRRNDLFRQTSDLVKAIKKQVPEVHVHKFLARVFQALRIEVNKEVDVLKRLLQTAPGALKQGGRLVVITYHSLEDRLVKNYIKKGSFSGEVEKDFYGNPNVPFKAVFSKAITPAEEELKENNRARSAKLRIAERL